MPDIDLLGIDALADRLSRNERFLMDMGLIPVNAWWDEHRANVESAVSRCVAELRRKKTEA